MTAKRYTNWDRVPVTFDLKTASLLLGCCEKTVRKLVKSGKLKAKTECRPWVFQKQDIQDYLNS